MSTIATGRFPALDAKAPNPRLWIVAVAGGLPAAPPYNPSLAITPHSTYADHVWSFPVAWVPPNARPRCRLDFLAPTSVEGRELKLCPVNDGNLLDQLKQLMVAYMFRRQTLARTNTRAHFGRPTGYHAYLQSARRFFVMLKHFGLLSASELRPDTAIEMASLASTSDTGFDSFVLVLRDLIGLSRQGQIAGGVRDLEFSVPDRERLIDTSAPIGLQPIPDEHLARLLELSLEYLHRSEEVARRLAQLRSEPARHRAEVLGWSRATLPAGPAIFDGLSAAHLERALAILVQVSAGNLFSFYAGLRASELLGARPGCVTAGGDGAYLNLDLIPSGRLNFEFRVFKTASSPGGLVRTVPAHPRLLKAQAAAIQIREVLAPINEELFIDPATRGAYVTGNWNSALQRFCDLHGIEHDLTSHQWRKAVSSVAVRVLTGSAMHLKEVLGHAGLPMTARYMLASPFIRAEIRDQTLDQYRRRGRTLLESITALGGGGLGGAYGKRLESSFADLIGNADVTESDLGMRIDKWVNEMLSTGIFPIPVMPGVFCMKPADAVGLCASSSGDRLADPARCSAACAFQVQQSHRRALVQWTIKRVAARWTTWSPVEQEYWASQCRDQLVAWPELESELSIDIEGWPTLRALVHERIS